MRNSSKLPSFEGLVPAVTLFFFIIAVGRPLTGLRLGIVNDEADCLSGQRSKFTCPALDSLNLDLQLGDELSCHFLDRLESNNLDLKFYSSVGEANRSSLLGRDVGFLAFDEHFSRSLSAKLLAMVTSGIDLDPNDIEASFIRTHLDWTNVEVVRSVTTDLKSSFFTLIRDYATFCHLEPEVVGSILSTGIKVHPLNDFGSDANPEVSLNLSMLPGMLILLMGLLPMALTADHLVTEREAGLLVRDLVADVPLYLVLLAQLVVQLLVVLVQILTSTVMLVVTFSDLAPDLVVLMIFLMLVQALSAMCMGFFVTSLSKTRYEVIQVGIAIIMPCFLLSGILWPRSTMPGILEVISWVLPTTVSSEVATVVVLNGFVTSWSLLSFGILIPVGWTLLTFGLCLLIISKWGIN